jgi:hypothetical protein
MKVTDTYSYKRYAPDVRGTDSVEIKYPADIPFMRLPLLFEENIYLGYEICRTPNPMNLAPN